MRDDVFVCVFVGVLVGVCGCQNRCEDVTELCLPLFCFFFLPHQSPFLSLSLDRVDEELSQNEGSGEGGGRGEGGDGNVKIRTSDGISLRLKVCLHTRTEIQVVFFVNEQSTHWASTNQTTSLVSNRV